MNISQVRSKTRAAIRRREDVIEEEELESGKITLTPYLDIVTTRMLFQLASVTAGLILVQINTTLPDNAPPSTTAAATPPAIKPDEQPLQLVVSVTLGEIKVWSLTGLEGTLKEPKATIPLSGQDGDACDGEYMCRSNVCDPGTSKCKTGPDAPLPVFDYRKLNQALYEIANRRYANKLRVDKTYQVRLMADQTIPYGTLISVMGAMRCKMPEFGKNSAPCYLPTADDTLKKAPRPIDDVGHLFDTTRAPYDASKMALFPDIIFSTGTE